MSLCSIFYLRMINLKALYNLGIKRLASKCANVISKQSMEIDFRYKQGSHMVLKKCWIVNRFSRPWKSIEFSQNVIMYWNSTEFSNSTICLLNFFSVPLMTALQIFFHCVPWINFGNLKISNGIKVFHLGLKRYEKSMKNIFWKCEGTLHIFLKMFFSVL